jgi:hypothetical protein
LACTGVKECLRPLADQVAFELGESTHDALQQVGHRGVLTREGQVLFLETDVNASLCQSKNDLPQIIQIAGKSIHRVADDRIALAHVADEQFKLRTVKIFARGFVDEPLVELHAFKLPKLFLVERADA